MQRIYIAVKGVDDEAQFAVCRLLSYSLDSDVKIRDRKIVLIVQIK